MRLISPLRLLFLTSADRPSSYLKSFLSLPPIADKTFSYSFHFRIFSLPTKTTTSSHSRLLARSLAVSSVTRIRHNSALFSRRLRFGFLNSQAMAVVAKVQELIQQNPLMVFSKSYCPYCRSVKELLKSLGAEAKVIELDQESDGSAIQNALIEVSKQRTVPNVFIGGEHVGGSDATKAAHKKGALVPMLKKAGVLKDEKEQGQKIEGASANAGGVQDLVKGVEEHGKDGFSIKDVVT